MLSPCFKFMYRILLEHDIRSYLRTIGEDNCRTIKRGEWRGKQIYQMERPHWNGRSIGAPRYLLADAEEIRLVLQSDPEWNALNSLCRA